MCLCLFYHRLGTLAALLLSDAKITDLGHTETCKVIRMTGEMNHKWCWGSSVHVCACVPTKNQAAPSLREKVIMSGQQALFPLLL